MFRPLVGITVDNKDNTAQSGTYESSIAYSRVVAEAGCLPMLLPHEPQVVADFVSRCDAMILTGGVDPRTEVFGAPTHPKARPIDPRRQQFEMSVLEACDRDRHKPVLGVCLGMQLMALHHGGRLHQFLPEVLDDADVHQAHRCHAIRVRAADSVLCRASAGAAGEFTVVSHHRQAVADPGSLRIAAAAPDGVIEAIDDATRRFYLGVQWHPERGDAGPANRGLFEQLRATCVAGCDRRAT